MTVKTETELETKPKNADPKILATLIIRSPDGMEYKPKSEKEEKYLREISEYEFSNIEAPGVPFNSFYGTTKKNEKIFMEHGGRYQLPRFMANWIRQRGTPRFEYKPGPNGQMIPKYAGMDFRFQLNEVF